MSTVLILCQPSAVPVIARGDSADTVGVSHGISRRGAKLLAGAGRVALADIVAGHGSALAFLPLAVIEMSVPGLVGVAIGRAARRLDQATLR